MLLFLPCRFIWLAAVLSAIGFFTFVVVSRVIIFRSYPTTVSVEVIYNDSLELPAITVCNHNSMR